MAIRTTVQPRQIWRNVIAGAVCLAFGIWGWYDFSVKIPAKERAVAEHRKLSEIKDSIEARRSRGESLSKAEIESYEAAAAELAARFKEAPAAPAAFDRAVQLWVYVIGCGVLGTPFFIWPLITMRRKQYALEDDGTLRFPEGSCRIDEVKSIDMSRWMEKSIATVTLADGTKSVLDDYKYKNLDKIVGAIAHRLHPEEWTIEAREVKADAEEPAAAPAASDEPEDASPSR